MKRLQAWLIIFAAAFITACGGGDNTMLNTTSEAGGGGDDSDPVVEMGSGNPQAFSAGVIEVAVPSLAAGGSSSLTVTFVTVADPAALFTGLVEVTFSSPCIASGLATITGANVVGNTAQTDTGIATVTYGATGCSGDDVITASATVDGIQRSAVGAVTVAASTVGSIEFESVSPAQIGLRGTGGIGIAETSTVVFRVVDLTGGPSIGRNVSFSLNTTVGDITLSPTTAISGADGRVQTVVQSGTIATSIRVTATVTDVTPTIGSQSSELVITTGLPDQNSVSLAVAVHNVEGLDLDGTLNEVTVRLSDRFNNPVPDGTAVTLSTEGGQIAGACTTTTDATTSGVCTVNWVSQNPRPIEKLPSRAGRATIYVTTIGEESFVDVNGSGFFDDDDTFTDLGEPYLDENENDGYDLGEPFVDFDNSGDYTGPDGLFSGLLCGGPDGSADTLNRCSPNPTMAISASNLIIMSGSIPEITLLTANPHASTGDTICYWIRDVNDQPMPAGTTVKVTTSNGPVVGPSSFTVPSKTDDSQAANTYCFSVAEAEPTSSPVTGNMFLEVKVPSGTTFTDSSVVIED